MNRVAYLLAVLVAIASGDVLAATADAHWDLACAYPASNYHTENLERFAADVDRATGGRLKIAVHPNATLYKAPEIKRAVQNGGVEAGEILLVNFESEDPLFGLDGIPFLATSYADAMKLYKASHKALDDRLARQGLKLLFTVPWPPQGIYTNRRLTVGADLRGLKWRATSAATTQFADLVGAMAVTLPPADVPRALASGVLDAYLSSAATGYDSRMYEELKYFLDARAWLPKNAVIVSRKAFDGLDKPAQAALVKAAADAEARGWKMSEERNAWYLEQLRAKGMTIVAPSEELTADLRKAGNVMLADWLRRNGADARRIIAAYRLM
jgi:TRAP-type C4-dicarboxylate transport system substrate-binding protein